MNQDVNPLAWDTLVVLLIQTGYFWISRKFLNKAGATLRNISSTDGSGMNRGFETAAENVANTPDRGGATSPAATPPNWEQSSQSDPLTEQVTDDSASEDEELSYPLLPLTTDMDTVSSLGRSETPELNDMLPGSVASKQRTTKTLRLLQHRRISNATGEGESNTSRKRLGRFARVLFSLSFSESLLLLTLVMFHSIGILSSGSRRLHFSISMHVLLLLILVVVPLTQCLHLTYRSTGRPASRSSMSMKRRFAISLLPFGVFMFLFSQIPPYIAANSASLGTSGQFQNGTIATTPSKSLGNSHRIVLPAYIHLGNSSELEPVVSEAFNETDTIMDPWYDQDWQNGGWLRPGLGRVVVCGIIAIASLSGFGAVNTACDFYERGGLRKGRTVTKEDIIAAERSLYRVRHDIIHKRQQISTLSHGEDANSSRWSSLGLGLFRGLGNANLPVQEMAALEVMEAQMKRSLNVMIVNKRRQRFVKTWRGKAYTAFGLIFALYCVARILICLTSVLIPRTSTSHAPKDDSPHRGKGNTNGDWISYLIALGLSQLPRGVVDVAMWSRAISLLLTGCLVLASLAQVLRNVSRIMRMTSKSIGAGFLLLGLSQLLSTYVISLLIQMRTYIPASAMDDSLESAISPNRDAPEPSLLATLPDFRVFGRLFDVVFVLVALGTGLYRYLGERLKGMDQLDLT